jgi:hypothetical protein
MMDGLVGQLERALAFRTTCAISALPLQRAVHLRASGIALWHRRLFTATKRRLRSPAVQTILPSAS